MEKGSTAHTLACAALAVLLIPLGILAAIAIVTHPGLRMPGGDILVGALGAVVYFGPGAAALSRHHRNAGAILLLNLLAGWTLVGWIIAAVWSATDNVAPPAAGQQRPSVQ
ncbi:MAG: superinfection immunity protein [Terriglobales bacterium]